MFTFASHPALKSLERFNTDKSIAEVRTLLSRYAQPAYQLLDEMKNTSSSVFKEEANTSKDYLWAQGPVPDTILKTLKRRKMDKSA